MKYTGFLCGAFSTMNNFIAYGNWHCIDIDNAEHEQICNYYYPEFVDFNFGLNNYSIKRYIMNISKEIPIEVGHDENTHNVNTFINNITLYQFPFQLMLFSICIEMQCTDNDVTAVVSNLRNINTICNKNKRYAETILSPLMEVYRKISPSAKLIINKEDAMCYQRLIEYGNKLKVFQIASIDKPQNENFDYEKLLFELGTVAPINSYNPEDDFSPSKAYLEKTMKNNCISIFNNWKGLSLFDTFTLLGHNISKGSIENWVNNYFNMIYISELFIKFYLFRLNNDFRINHEHADKLLEEFDEFEYNCWFDHISYNFLPRIIHQSIEKGLEILPEKQKLYKMIERQKDKREQKVEQRMNNLLFYLTLFTTFSMVWDASSLFNEMYPYETYMGSNIEGFRLVSYTLLLVVLLLIILTRFKKR